MIHALTPNSRRRAVMAANAAAGRARREAERVVEHYAKLTAATNAAQAAALRGETQQESDARYVACCAAALSPATGCAHCPRWMGEDTPCCLETAGPHGKLTPEGQRIEDAAILRRIARELEALAPRWPAHGFVSMMADELNEFLRHLDA